jgi:hypothetical protein
MTFGTQYYCDPGLNGPWFLQSASDQPLIYVKIDRCGKFNAAAGRFELASRASAAR